MTISELFGGEPNPLDLYGVRVIANLTYPDGKPRGADDVASIVVNARGDMDVWDVLNAACIELGSRQTGNATTTATVEVESCGMAMVYPGPLSGGTDI